MLRRATGTPSTPMSGAEMKSDNTALEMNFAGGDPVQNGGFNNFEGGAMRNAGAPASGSPWTSVNSVVAASPGLDVLLKQVAVVTAVGGLLSLLMGDIGYAIFVLTIACNGLLFSKYMCDWLLAKDTGTPEMREVCVAGKTRQWRALDQLQDGIRSPTSVRCPSLPP